MPVKAAITNVVFVDTAFELDGLPRKIAWENYVVLVASRITGTYFFNNCAVFSYHMFMVAEHSQSLLERYYPAGTFPHCLAWQ